MKHASVWFAAAALVACSSTSESERPSARTLALSISTDVPAGSEIHKCQFVKVPADRGGHVRQMSHSYTPGSHHLVLFRTALTEIPAGSEGVIDCYSAGREVMGHARGVLYASQTEKEETKLPEGVGLPMAKDSVLLLQAHYLNANASVLSARVEVALTLADEGTIKEEAGVLFFYDPFIVVPPRAKASAAMRCSVPKDIKLLGALSHMHKRGVGFEAFLDSPSGELSSTPFYSSNDWEHPLPMRTPLSIAAGSRIRFRCDYQNADEAAVLQGQSAATNEMCVFTGLYHPAMTSNDDLCFGGADMFGVGAQNCSEGLSCVQACPAGSAPRFAAGGVPDVHECWQKCLAGTCASASTPLFAQLGCLRTKCEADCAEVSGTTCAACVIRECGSEYSACNSHACAE